LAGRISQTVGASKGISVHSAFVEMRDGDLFILGSHGVAHVLAENVVIPMARSARLVPAHVVAEVMRRAEGAEGHSDDDKTVIVVRVREEGPTKETGLGAMISGRRPTPHEAEEQYPESE